MSALSTFNPIWDQSRACVTVARTYEDDDFLIATDFEGGNGSNMRKIAADHYAIDLEPEPGDNPYGFSGIAYYVCFGVQNKSGNERTVQVRLHGNCKGREDFSAQRHMVIRRGSQWEQLSPNRIYPIYEHGAVVPDVLEIEIAVPGCTDDDGRSTW